MLKTFIVLITILSFLSCSEKNSKKIDKVKAEKLFKESTPLFKKFLELKLRDEDSARLMNKQLIEKYEQIYNTDTTNEFVGFYLASFYYYAKQYSKALDWHFRQLQYDTSETEVLTHNSGIAFSYINLGQFDLAKPFLQKVIAADKLDKTLFRIQIMFQNYKALASNIYNQEDRDQIALLKSKNIIPCLYSIDLLQYMLPIAQDCIDSRLIPFNRDTISNWKNSCH